LSSTSSSNVISKIANTGNRAWNDIAMSYSGQYQTATVLDGFIYVSHNYGLDWTERATSQKWRAVSMSANGRFQTAVSNTIIDSSTGSGNIFCSTDYGLTWTIVPGWVRTFSSVAVSGTGQHQLATHYDTYLRSSNYGQSWDSYFININGTSLASLNFKSVAISYSGAIIAVVAKENSKIYISYDYGTTWSEKHTSLTGRTKIAMSSSGQYMIASRDIPAFLFSRDFGENWTEPSTGYTPTDVAISPNGEYHIVPCLSSRIVYGNNYFNTITYKDATGIQYPFSAAALSENGKYGTITTNGGYMIFSSSFPGTNGSFNNNDVASYEITKGDQSGTSVSLAADGSVVAIGAPYSDSSANIIDRGQVRVWTWNGTTWSQRGNDIFGEATNNQSGFSVSMSADGNTVAIGAPYNNGANGIDSGHVRVYKWNGTSWVQAGTVDIDGEAGLNILSATSSQIQTSTIRPGISISKADGKYQTTTLYNNAMGINHIYTSSDYGVTWYIRRLKQFSNQFSNSTYFAMSYTGEIQYAASQQRQIYKSIDYGITWTELSNSLDSNNSSMWIDIATSYDGKYVSATGQVGNISTSDNYGETWTKRESSRGNRLWGKISMSSNGVYQLVSYNTGNGYNDSGVLLSYDYGASWVDSIAASTTVAFTVTAVSATGRYQIAGTYGEHIYVSNNYGALNSWTKITTFFDYFMSAAISADGKYMSLVTNNMGRIIYNSNYGNSTSWSSIIPSVIAGSTNIETITMTSDGKLQVAVASNKLVWSQDYGVSWSDYTSYESKPSSSGDQSGYSISLSADGNSLAVGAPYNDGTSGFDRGHIRVFDYNTTNQTWGQRGTDNDGEAASDLAGWSVSMSADGATVAFGAPMNDGSGNLLPNSGSVRVFNTPITNAITYTSATPSVADICGNLLIIKSNGSSAITATQGGTNTNSSLVVSGTSYTLTYTSGTTSTTSYIYYSKNYGSSWSILDPSTSRAWSSVAISENGSTISATASDASGAIFTYTMPDDQFYRSPPLLNSGSTTPATVRAITYGNSGTGAAVDGYWVAGADAAANTLAYSSNGVDWTAVVGSKTTLFNAVNGVAYGADTTRTPLWVAVGQPFVGSVPGSTAFSIAYSYNLTTWTGVRNSSNFTGQGNHVAYGQDEFGEGIWVAVGQSDGVLAANLGNSSFGNSNGTAGTTIFYSYDGANWAAGTGLGVFAVSGTDVTWGVDASGVATWVATGVGFTDPLTGVFNSGGQVAHSLNGRVWTLISTPRAIIGPTTTTLSATTRGSAMVAPPASSTGFIPPTYNNIWRMLGTDIDGEAVVENSGYPVTLSADGTVVAIGGVNNNGSGNLLSNSGHVRVYKYNPNKTVAQLNQNLPGFGPAGWDRLGGDIDGQAVDDSSGWSVSLSADGTTVAIGAIYNDGSGNNVGHVRIYKYRAGKTEPQLTNPAATATDFGPAGWDRLGGDIHGEAPSDNSGWSVSLSADGTTVAIGAPSNSNSGYTTNGHVRVYNYNPTKLTAPVRWQQLGADIDGELGSDQSGYSVSLSADGTTVAIGARLNDGGGNTDGGHVRVYKYTPGKAAVTNQTDLSFGPIDWTRLGADIDSEAADDDSGHSVSLSADGTVVAIGAITNDSGGNSNAGHVRVYKYTPGKAAVTNQTDPSFGPIGWTRLGQDIDGELYNDYSGQSVSLSADGAVVAIGAPYNDGSTANISDIRGHVRVYKYNAAKTNAITDQSLPNFGPAGWDRIGVDIDGEASGDQSGMCVSLSADGTTLAIGANTNDGAGVNSGHVRVYKLDTYGAITYTSSNPAVADVYGNALLLINDISDGVTTITATQAAVPPFTLAPITVQGTLTVIGKTTRTLVYNSIVSTYTPFSTSALTVAYGRGGSQGTGAPRWIVGGSGTNVFAISSRPSATTTGTWSVVATNDAAAPFAVCNSLGYSNGVWVAGNNTDATNVLARSIDGGVTWSPVTSSSVSNIIAGASAIGANAFCNYSLAYADYSNDTNLRSWVGIQGTKNFMFDGGVNTVATVTPNIAAGAYNITNRAWWVAGGRNQFVPQRPGNASIAYTTDPSGATGWTSGTSTTANSGNGIIDLEEIRDITFSPHTQNWLAVGVGSAATPTRTALYSSDGIAWTSAVVSSTDASLNLNTCAWNQLDVSASATGRWLVGGTRSGVDASAVSLFISADVSGQNWTPITGTGAILSQVYSLAYNGRVWIAAGTPATSNGSTSTLMRTTDPTGATGWQGIAATNVSTSGFDTAARSVTWNADQNMWVATGENTGSTADASFSSVIYSLDVSGSAGTWRTVRESNSICFSGEGTGIAFTGDKLFASGEGTNQIVATAGTSAANASTASWTPIAHGTALTRASDIAYTGRRLIATGASTSGTSNGVILSTDNSGSVWAAAPATPGPGFTDALGGATSITFEASYEGVGRAIATGRSATNALSVSTDGGTTWSAPSVQYSSTYLYENYGPITARTATVGFPILNSLQNWIIDISFITTGGLSTWRPLLGSMYNSVDTNRGWGIWVGNTNQIHYGHINAVYDSFIGDVSLNVVYNLNVTKVGSSVTLRLTTVSSKTVLTNTITVTSAMGVGPVELYGFSTGELFIGTIGYVIVSDHSKSTPSATTQPLFTTGGNSVAYVGNDTLFAGGGNDVQWTGKRWVATGRTSTGATTAAAAAAVTSTSSGSAPLPDIVNSNTSAVATSDDGITWQCVSTSQAPNLSEGTFLASNPRIGATSIINSQIVIADGGDTEASADYGGMVCEIGGSGTGVAQIDIIAELTPVSTAASSVVSGAVNILGTGAAGNVPSSASFDNTAFTITTRPT
jgi:hypothetical protein